MFPSESSTNTDNEVFKEPRGLNKLLWKVKRETEGQRWMKWRRCDIQLREGVGSGAFCFLYFNQKQRHAAVENA